ncbi:Alpha/Beta hydrolase protein [Mycena galericulata]|nr:Alpha/Beta hydrolase protein [Mycena galericulata]
MTSKPSPGGSCERCRHPLQINFKSYSSDSTSSPTQFRAALDAIKAEIFRQKAYLLALDENLPARAGVKFGCLPDHGRVRPSPQTAPLAVTQICRQWRESHFAPTSSGTVLISDSSLTVGHISVAPPYFTPQGVSRMTLFPGVPYSTPNYTWISEACLTLDVFTPASNRGAKLPVLVLSPIISWYPHVLSADKVAFWWWFQRGIFLCHRHAAHSRALHCREPVVIVAAKYRLSVFGFLSGKEAKIFALEEVQLHISAFGDDPERVVLGGGKCRTDVHGALTPIQQTRLAGIVPRRVHASQADGQPYYDQLVAANNCTAVKNTLECLRGIPYDAFRQ